jgi:hypothetical protein
MISKGVREGAVTTALAGTAGVAGSYAIAGATRSFIVVPAESLVVGVLPGAVVATGVRWLGFFAETLAFATAILLAVGVLGIGVPLAFRLVDARISAVVVATVWAFTVALVATASLPAIAAALPVGAVGLLRSRSSARGDSEAVSGRRRWLRHAAGVLGFTGVSYTVGSGPRGSRRSADGPVLEDRMAELRDEIDRSIATARARSFDLPGMPGLVSSRDAFYEVDINTVDPDVDATTWSLSVTGAVDRVVTLSMEDLFSAPPEHRFVTLRCVSDPVDGELMDTAIWTGLPVASILDRANPRGSWVMLRSVDGYHVGFPIEALEGGFLAYGMNGRALPRSHGYPLRALVPGHWGEVNAKWLEEIEVLEAERDGYWEKRGWHGTGPVNTISKIWSASERDDGIVELGGHAYAGTRGISKVEVLPGSGSDWREAELSQPLEGDDVWRQWRYEWKPPGEGIYTLVVRATDGEGDLSRDATSVRTRAARPGGCVAR